MTPLDIILKVKILEILREESLQMMFWHSPPKTFNFPVIF